MPKNYLIIKHRFLSELVSRSPKITIGKRKDGPIIYVQTSDGKRHRIKINSPKAGKLMLQNSVTEIAKTTLGELELHFKNEYGSNIINEPDYHKNRNTKSRLDRSFFDSLKDNASTYPNNNKYYLDGYYFRSRVEYIIASVLKDMGLEYKYDCSIKVGDKGYTIDFTVYVKELDACFFIEYLGRLDDKKYCEENRWKIMDYLRCGLYPGKDVLFFCGNEREMPGIDLIESQLKSILEVMTKAAYSTVGGQDSDIKMVHPEGVLRIADLVDIKGFNF